MPTLLSTYGTTLLLLQEAMRGGVHGHAGADLAPNYYVVSLPVDALDPVEAADFRHDLRDEVLRFAEANDWSLQSRPVVALLTGEFSSEEPAVEARIAERFGLLEIADDRGVRRVELTEPAVVLGRRHTGPPRDFVPVEDASRSLSREHLSLRFDGRRWSAELCGQNRTELNGEEIASGSTHRLSVGDHLLVEPHRITLLEDEPSCRQQ